jgi:hypothetical protein
MTSSDVQDARDEIIVVAKAMVAGQVALIEGARRLCDLRHRIGASDSPLFNPIVGFESETDDYPIGPQREVYSEEALASLDEEIRSYVAEARPGVISACNEIIVAMSDPSTNC